MICLLALSLGVLSYLAEKAWSNKERLYLTLQRQQQQAGNSIGVLGWEGGFSCQIITALYCTLYRQYISYWVLFVLLFNIASPLNMCEAARQVRLAFRACF